MAMNDKLVARTDTGDTANADASSDDIGLLNAVDLPIIVISRDCRITRMNRAATTVLGLAASDLGCSVANTLAGAEDLGRVCARAIADGTPCRTEAHDGDRHFLIRIAPYAGSNREIQGAVLTFTNVTAFRASIDQAIYEREYTKSILNTVTDPLVVLDAKLQVQTANRAFYSLFGVSRDQTQDISIRQLGNHEWEISEVWKSIETTVSGHAQFQPVAIVREFPTLGPRTVVLDARRLARQGADLILLTFQDVTERKQAEQALSEQARLLDLSSDAIFVRDSADRVTYWNRAATELYGFTREEALGRVTHDFLHTEFPTHLDQINQELHRAEHWSGELVHTTKDGAKVVVISRWVLDRKANGNTWCILETNNDITQQKRTEKALRESEERFRAIVETTPECVKLVSADGTLLHMNSPGLQMVDAASADEVVGKSIYDLIAPADRDRFKTFNERICQGENGSLQFDIVGLEGKRRHMETHAAPLRNPDGTVVQLAVTSDISERKQAEELLRRSEERFRALVNASSDVVYRMSHDWAEMRHLDGRGFVADTGDPTKDWLNEYIHADDQPLVLQAIREAVLTKTMFQLEHRVRRMDGTLGWTYSRAVPLVDVNGQIVEWFGAASDVTARKEAEEKYRKLVQTLDSEVRARTRELEEQSKQVRELSWRLLRSQDEERRHIARELHDSVGQTLTALGIHLALLIEEEGHKIPEAASKFDQIAEMVQQLHREIRTTSYLLHPPLLDESGLLSAISWYVQGLLERSGLEVRLEISKDFERVPREMELMIFRLVQECLTNMHRHSESKTALIRIVRESNQIILDIRDQGKGMSATRLAEIQSGRSGLGIRGMRERLRQFEGRMSIESDSSGTRVFATIPLLKPASPKNQSGAEPLRAAF
ncbi:MAG TPA: PAS domain S-box protein [Candidatus Deferrimicrobiaceae bacterium]|jgi:PAS domain S-box-containing protein|nr:PAS domain S-box protein [Candidatus Deferrimicrobiaceae bacterium]